MNQGYGNYVGHQEVATWARDDIESNISDTHTPTFNPREEMVMVINGRSEE